MPGGGFVDTVRSWGTWGVAASEPVTSASNQYAAMPSMHVGWALWCGVVVARHVRRPAVQALGMAYPSSRPSSCSRQTAGDSTRTERQP